MSEEKWTCNDDEDVWSSGEEFDTREAAIEGGKELYAENGFFYIGIMRKPMPPEIYWGYDDWLRTVDDQDDYRNDFGDDWCDATKEQFEELDDIVQLAIGAWLDKHKLRPKFHVIEKIEKIEIERKS